MTARPKPRLVFCAGCGLNDQGRCTCSAPTERQAYEFEPLMLYPQVLWFQLLQRWLRVMMKENRT